MKSRLLQLTIFSWLLCLVHPSIYHLSGPVHGWESTEKVYGTNKGPVGHQGGSSSLSVIFHVKLIPEKIEWILNGEYELAVAAFLSYADGNRLFRNTCGMNASTIDPQTGVLSLKELNVTTDTQNNTDREWVVEKSFDVLNSGNQRAVVQTCWRKRGDPFYTDYQMSDVLLDFDGSIIFKNPYGYLSGLLYGMLPFSGVLALAYGMLDIFFIVVFIRHRKNLLNLQYFILLVLFLGTFETWCWYLTYEDMNQTGKPICCPYPTLFLVSTTSKIFAQMIARELLLLISLGYGVVRPSITRPEVLLLTGLGLCYTVSGVALEINQAISRTSGQVSPPFLWAMLQVGTNSVFAVWIYGAIGQTRSSLKESNQTAKYRMYDQLVKVLMAFMLLSLLLLVLEGAVYSHYYQWKWQNVWMLWAASRALNFFVVFAMCFIWRPSTTSVLYAYHSQLPMNESDIVEDNIGCNGVEMGIVGAKPAGVHSGGDDSNTKEAPTSL